MKFNKENVKDILEECLKKEGSTIQEFEEYLSGQQKQAQDKAKAKAPLGLPIVINAISKSPAIGINLALILASLSAGAGAIGGMGAYSGINASKDSDNKINEQLETKRKIDAARREIESFKAQRGLEV